MNYFNLHLSIGICIGLVAIVVYCFYKTMKVIPELFRALKENNKARKELAEFLNNQKAFSEVLKEQSDVKG